MPNNCFSSGYAEAKLIASLSQIAVCFLVLTQSNKQELSPQDLSCTCAPCLGIVLTYAFLEFPGLGLASFKYCPK